MTKQLWLQWAEIFDSWRVIPRLFFGCYWIATFVFIFQFAYWYCHLPANERGYEESGSMVAIIGLLTKFGQVIFDTYSKNGRDWNSQPASMTATTLVKSTTTTGAI